MAENLYEGMFLLDSGKFAADPEGITSELLALLEKVGASVDAHRPWQDGKLAYPIEGRRKGLHYLTYFKMPTSSATELTRRCKLSDIVLRHLVIKQPPSLYSAMVDALSGGSSDEASEETAEAEKTDKNEVAETAAADE